MNKNKLLVRLLDDKERYADMINGYAGAKVVRAEDLSEMDSLSHAFPSYGDDRHMTESGEKSSKKANTKSKRKTKERYRDLVRRSAYGLNFAIIGVENQSDVHYLMPLRAMSYDVAEYEKQAYRIRQKVRKMKNITPAEFLSGFLKTDRLHPCITIVLYWGDNWDGAKDLYDLLNFENIPPELRKLVNNYPIHLIDISKFENTDVFETDLKQIFDFIRCSKDGAKLKELVNSDKAYQNMDEAAYDVIAAFTHAKELTSIKPVYKEGGKVDMCEGIRQLIAEGKDEGISIGRNEGISIGRSEGISIGRNEGISIGRNEGISIGRNEGISIGKNDTIKELIRKKLSKGKSIPTIADELEESVAVIEGFIAAM